MLVATNNHLCLFPLAVVCSEEEQTKAKDLSLFPEHH